MDAEMDNNGDHLEYCKECITRMSLAFEMGVILGSVRPWNHRLIERNIADFLHTSLNREAVRRRRFEVAWATILRGARSALLGSSDELTITDLDLIWHETTRIRAIWFDTGRRTYIERYAVHSLLEVIIRYL